MGKIINRFNYRMFKCIFIWTIKFILVGSSDFIFAADNISQSPRNPAPAKREAHISLFIRPVRGEPETIINNVTVDNYLFRSSVYRFDDAGATASESHGKNNIDDSYPISFNVFRIFRVNDGMLLREVWSNEISMINIIDKYAWRTGRLGNLRYLAFDEIKKSVYCCVSVDTSRSETSIEILEIPIDSTSVICSVGNCVSEGGRIFKATLSPRKHILAIGVLVGKPTEEGVVLLHLGSMKKEPIPVEALQNKNGQRIKLLSIGWNDDETVNINCELSGREKIEKKSINYTPDNR